MTAQHHSTSEDNAPDWGEALKQWQDFALAWGNKSQEFWSTAFEKYSSTDWMKQPFDPYNLKESWASYFESLIEHPEKFQEAQADLMARFVKNATEIADNTDKDANLFVLIKDNYRVFYDWVMENMDDSAQNMNAEKRRKLEFFTRQYLDALNPNNYIFTNPQVVDEILKTNGHNLINGFENLIEDMKKSKDIFPKISTANEDAFKLGENIAVTKGTVIFRNDMVELIQYTPLTKNVYKTPILFIPPWINKYYILDLRPEKSMVEWLLQQGHQVFMISWKNPDGSYAEKTFDDYMLDGIIASLDATKDITGSNKVHMSAYCIGGTLLSMTLSYMLQKGRRDEVASATFLTTLVDFQHSGDIKLFIDEKQIEQIEYMMKDKGFLNADALKTTFAMLRANHLIWSFVVNNYLLGKDPLPFDLLYWNNDSTNLPAAMHSYYLRNMYLHNRLIEPNALKIGGVPIDISKIDVPCFFLSAKEDHIAPWIATYEGAKRLKKTKDSEFVLAGSGHIAGVVNPPAKNKYGHWLNPKWADTPNNWLEGAKAQNGSWWPHWNKWLDKHSADKKNAPKSLGSKKYKPLCPAPGTYVLEQADLK